MSNTPPPTPSRTVQKYDYSKPTNVTGLENMAKELMPQIKAALPSFLASTAERMIRCLLTECGRNPKLLDCTPRSLIGGLIVASQLGLELGPALGQAYLVPFKGNAQLIPGYRGYITLAHRSGQVKRITPETVREKDVFRLVRGTNQSLIHEPHPDCDGQSTGYYAIIELVNGGVDFEYMTKGQAEKHRDRYALSKTGPWLTEFDAMAEKTCILRLGKRIPLSVEWNTAVGLEGMIEAGEDQKLGAVVSGVDKNTADSLRDRLDEAKAPPVKDEPPPRQPGEDDLFDGGPDPSLDNLR